MQDLIVDFEPHVRLSAFLSVFVLVALWELVAPRRPLRVSRTVRWTSNIGIVVLDTVILRLVFPAAAAGTAAAVGSLGWGLFNALQWPFWFEVVLAVVVLDLVIYCQHVMLHAVPGLWRLHMVHHADLDFDVTTGVRFHPFEILLSMVIKVAAIGALGAAPLAVILFEIVLSSTSIFNHGNVVLPSTLDRFLRLIVGHSRNAPGASLGDRERDQQQLRIQSALVGPDVRNLPRPAGGGPREDDHRARAVPRAALAVAVAHGGAPVHGLRGPVSARPVEAGTDARSELLRAPSSRVSSQAPSRAKRTWERGRLSAFGR